MYKNPVSPYDPVGGLVYFARLTDKIRLHARGELHPDWVGNLGTHFDGCCVNFLGVSYVQVVEWVKSGADDAAVLERCFSEGRRPSADDIVMWNGYMTRRGWRDALAARLAQRKAESGLADRADIACMFDYIDADEGRAPGGVR